MSDQAPVHVEAGHPGVAPPRPGPPPRCTDPCALVIFGASGDLAHRKLAPALFHLGRDGLLPEHFAIVGFSRRPENSEALRKSLRRGLETASTLAAWDDPAWQRFSRLVHHIPGDIADPESYRRLAERLAALDASDGTAGNRLYYLATPPDAFEPILRGLQRSGLLRRADGSRLGASGAGTGDGCRPGDAAPRASEGAGDDRPPAGFSRVVIEKPFGHDLPSALALNHLVHGVLDESQTFRIDHFLGKETVQNILVFRFGNSLFEPLWNRKYIDHVEITAAETLGVEKRGRFYDGVGVVRDMLQNHLLQVLALCAMELPVTFKADDVRDARVQLFRSLRPLLAHDVGEQAVLGQYEGYRREPDVAADSRTPSYLALKVLIDNWRWQGVPFYLRTGKKLAARRTDVTIHFQPIPMCLFGSDDVCRQVQPNVLTLRIQPDEGISLRFASKLPGEELDVASVTMDFSYRTAFRAEPQDAYHRLLLDALRGDATLFTRGDEVERCWQFVTPLLDAWERPAGDPMPLATYAAGSEGPAEAEALTGRDRRLWTPLR